MNGHTRECIEATRLQGEAAAAYEKQWPNHCRSCNGWGIIGSGQPSRDTGFPDIDPCPTCGDHDICARCGKKSLNADEGIFKCPECGFDAENGEGGKPDVGGDCGCWYMPEPTLT